MKTIFKQSILELVSQEVSNAEMNVKVIDRFELSADEYTQLKHEMKLCGMGVGEDIIVYGIPVYSDPITSTLKPSKLQKAIKVLCDEFMADKGLYQSYQANIAMAFYDNYRWYFEEKGMTVPPQSMDIIHKIANNSAHYFLKVLIGASYEPNSDSGACTKIKL